MIKTEEICSFLEVVDAGNITRAAERLRIAKSSVSRHISELELKLGAQLLKRSTRRMTLTDAGRRFYESSARLKLELEQIETSVTTADSALSGVIRIAAPSSFGPRHIGPALIEFSVQYPDIEFDVDFNDRQIDIIEEGFDIAVRIAKLSDSRLVARRIASLSTTITASPGYWKQHGKPKLPGDLANHRCLHFTRGRGTNWSYREKNNRIRKVKVGSALQANNGGFLVDAAVAGLGVICQPAFMTSEAVKAGLLEAVLTKTQWSDLVAYVIYPETRYLPQRIRRLIDFLATRWGDSPI